MFVYNGTCNWVVGQKKKSCVALLWWKFSSRVGRSGFLFLFFFTLSKIWVVNVIKRIRHILITAKVSMLTKQNDSYHVHIYMSLQSLYRGSTRNIVTCLLLSDLCCTKMRRIKRTRNVTKDDVCPRKQCQPGRFTSEAAK